MLFISRLTVIVTLLIRIPLLPRNVRNIIMVLIAFFVEIVVILLHNVLSKLPVSRFLKIQMVVMPNHSAQPDIKPHLFPITKELSGHPVEVQVVLPNVVVVVVVVVVQAVVIHARVMLRSSMTQIQFILMIQSLMAILQMILFPLLCLLMILILMHITLP